MTWVLIVVFCIVGDSLFDCSSGISLVCFFDFIVCEDVVVCMYDCMWVSVDVCG